MKKTRVQCNLHCLPLRNPIARLRRAGLTLLEIVLATALFLGAVTALAQLAWNGQRAAIQARLRTEAVFRCETKLAEILSGVERFQSAQHVAFPDDPQWTWSAQVLAGQLPELLHVAVRVEHSGKSPLTNVGFTLERWTRDPMLFIEAAAAQSESTTTTQTSSSSSSSSSSGSSSQSSGGSR